MAQGACAANLTDSSLSATTVKQLDAVVRGFSAPRRFGMKRSRPAPTTIVKSIEILSGRLADNPEIGGVTALSFRLHIRDIKNLCHAPDA